MTGGVRDHAGGARRCRTRGATASRAADVDAVRGVLGPSRTPRSRAADRVARRGVDPIRVLWLVKGLGPGGAERLLVAAAAHRDRGRFAITCAYLLPWKRQLVPELEALGVRTVCLDVQDERDVRWAARLRRHLRAEPVDVLHAHSPYPAGIGRIVARTLPASARPATVYTLHNTWTSFATPTRLLNGWTMGWDAADLAVSGLVRDTVPDRLRGAHGGRGARRRPRRRWPRPTRPGRHARRARDRARRGGVRHGGELPRAEGLPEPARRRRGAAGPGVPVRIVAVGQGPLEEEMRAEHARLGLAGRVELLGERADAVRVMSGCDAFVLASNNEGLPVAVMEALALGLPVVGTAVGGMTEAVDATNGVLVPARDPQALAGAIEALVADPARRGALGAGATASAARFDIARSVERIEAVVRAGGAAGRRPAMSELGGAAGGGS